MLNLRSRSPFRAGQMLACGAFAIELVSHCLAADQPTKKPSDQLYVEVAALGSLDYFYDHKLGLQKAGEALGVKTQYVGPAEYDISAMVTAFEQAIAQKETGIIVIGFESSLNALG
jgi:ribose transport system substrate-binding protein